MDGFERERRTLLAALLALPGAGGLATAAVAAETTGTAAGAVVQPVRAAAPRPPPRRPSSSMRVRATRVPDMPTGWPRAMAPPLTLTMSSLMPRSAIEARPTAAKASFSSITSKSAGVSPSRAISFLEAGAGPKPMMRGATPAVAPPRIRAIGVRP